MLELRTFGGLELRTEDGEPLEALAERTKLLALLAYLAAEASRGGVPRETVAALLWPGGTDGDARNSLRVALTHIRQATAASLVDGEGASNLRLVRDHVRADVTAFQEALEAGEEARALDIYEGDFLAGVRVRGAREFRRWADDRRGRHRREAYEAALSLGASAREAGDLAAAEERFRRALDLAPLREEPAQQLIRTLADRARTADAVQFFEAFRRRRREELELPVSEELEERVVEMKRGVGGRALEEAGAAGGREAGLGTRGEREEEGEPEVTGDGAAADDAEPKATTGTPSFHRWMGRVALVLVLVLAPLAVWRLMSPGGEAPAATPENSIAVLPFEAIGTVDPGPIAEGLHADLLTRLSGVDGLSVISGTSVERFREAELPLPAIADSLRVTWVVEGEVQRTGGEITIHAQLIDPRTDTHAWAASYRRELTAGHLFDVQRAITREIVRSLEVELGPEEGRLARRATGSLAAHRFYLRGRALLEQRDSPQMRQALRYFEQALAEDSSYALAWAGVADALSLLARTSAVDPDTLLPAAGEAARRALTLDPDLAEAHVARGRLAMYRREGPAALRAFRRAGQLKPSYAPAHAWRAKILLSLGRPGPALPAARRAVELDPLSRENNGTLCWALIANDRGEEALEVARRINELERENDDWIPVYEHQALATVGSVEKLRALERELERSGDLGSFNSLPALVTALAAEGDTTPAVEMLARLEERETPPTFVRIPLHGALGQEDRAFELIEAAFPREERVWDFPFAVWLRYFFPAGLDPLREDPRWDRFVARMNRHWGLNEDGSLPDSLALSFSAPSPG